MTFPRFLPAVMLAAAFGCAAPATAPPPAPSAAASAWLPPGEPELVHFLPPPPAAGSADDARDLEAVLAIQARRSAADVESARLDQEVSVGRFADVLGAGFTAERLPATFRLAQRACREASGAVGAAKRHWDRPRPFRASPAVQRVITNVSDGSYPSGHATCGYLWAILLADLVPERRDALFARGIAYGDNRVVGGVHYPTDVAAGRLAAGVVAATLYASPAFRAAIGAARAELAAAATPAAP